MLGPALFVDFLLRGHYHGWLYKHAKNDFYKMSLIYQMDMFIQNWVNPSLNYNIYTTQTYQRKPCWKDKQRQCRTRTNSLKVSHKKAHYFIYFMIHENQYRENMLHFCHIFWSILLYQILQTVYHFKAVICFKMK